MHLIDASNRLRENAIYYSSAFIFSPLPFLVSSRAPDVTGEAQTVWPSHRDLHRDPQRRVGVFVFYSQCKSHRVISRGGGKKVGRIRQLAGVKTQWQFCRLLDCAVSIIRCALSGSRSFFSQIPSPPPPLPPPPPSCCHCQIRCPRLTKLFLDFAANRESFFFFFLRR